MDPKYDVLLNHLRETDIGGGTATAWGHITGNMASQNDLTAALNAKISGGTTLSHYGIIDAYTKTETYTKAEVDGKITGVYHYKGSLASIADLPLTGNTQGDVWHVAEDASGSPNNYAWTLEAASGALTDWNPLGGEIDLSAYAKTADVNTALATKQNNLVAGNGILLNGNTISAGDITPPIDHNTIMYGSNGKIRTRVGGGWEELPAGSPYTVLNGAWNIQDGYGSRVIQVGTFPRDLIPGEKILFYAKLDMNGYGGGSNSFTKEITVPKSGVIVSPGTGANDLPALVVQGFARCDMCFSFEGRRIKIYNGCNSYGASTKTTAYIKFITYGADREFIDGDYIDTDNVTIAKDASKKLIVKDGGVTAAKLAADAVNAKLAAGANVTLSYANGTTTIAAAGGTITGLVAGANIAINGNTISATDTKYVAGENITIVGNTISATGGGTSITVVGGTGTTVTTEGSTTTVAVDFTQVQKKLVAGANLTLDGNTISATDTTYSAGSGLKLVGGVFSFNESYIEISGEDLILHNAQTFNEDFTIVNGKLIFDGASGMEEWGAGDIQHKLIAGANVTLDGNTISATGGTGSVAVFNLYDPEKSYGFDEEYLKNERETVESTTFFDAVVEKLNHGDTVTLNAGSFYEKLYITSVALNVNTPEMVGVSYFSAYAAMPGGDGTSATPEIFTFIKDPGDPASGKAAKTIKLYTKANPEPPSVSFDNETIVDNGLGAYKTSIGGYYTPAVPNILNAEADPYEQSSVWLGYLDQPLSEDDSVYVDIQAGATSIAGTYAVALDAETNKLYIPACEWMTLFIETDTEGQTCTATRIDGEMFSVDYLSVKLCSTAPVYGLVQQRCIPIEGALEYGGTGIRVNSGSVTYWSGKQDAFVTDETLALEGGVLRGNYVAGDNITIEGNVISATGGGGTSVAGENGITASGNTVSLDTNFFSVTTDTLNIKKYTKINHCLELTTDENSLNGYPALIVGKNNQIGTDATHSVTVGENNINIRKGASVFGSGNTSSVDYSLVCGVSATDTSEDMFAVGLYDGVGFAVKTTGEVVTRGPIKAGNDVSAYYNGETIKLSEMQKKLTAGAGVKIASNTISTVEVVTDTSTANPTIAKLFGGTHFVFGTAGTITISSVEDSAVEAVVMFTAGSTTNLVVPATLKWKNGIAVTPQAGKNYILAVMHNSAIMDDFEVGE